MKEEGTDFEYKNVLLFNVFNEEIYKDKIIPDIMLSNDISTAIRNNLYKEIKKKTFYERFFGNKFLYLFKKIK